MIARAILLLALLPSLALAQGARPPQSTPLSQASGTVTTGGTFQTVLAANPNRTTCVLQNQSTTDIGYVYWLGTGTATTSNSLQLKPGDVFTCVGAGGMPIRTAIQYTATGSSDPFMIAENN